MATSFVAAGRGLFREHDVVPEQRGGTERLRSGDSDFGIPGAVAPPRSALSSAVQREFTRRAVGARIVSGEIPLDIFVFEGTVVQAPNGTGQWNRFAGRAMKDWVTDLSKVAGHVVAVGDCATWGGIPATAP